MNIIKTIEMNINWMIASLDGIDIDNKTLVEIKCPGEIDHSCAMDGQVPEKYPPAPPA